MTSNPPPHHSPQCDDWDSGKVIVLRYWSWDYVVKYKHWCDGIWSYANTLEALFWNVLALLWRSSHFCETHVKIRMNSSDIMRECTNTFTTLYWYCTSTIVTLFGLSTALALRYAGNFQHSSRNYANWLSCSSDIMFTCSSTLTFVSLCQEMHALLIGDISSSYQ